MNYFMIGGDKREYGPVDTATIRQWLQEGRANGETLLRLENETLWKPLRTFPEFEAEFPGALPSPPPQPNYSANAIGPAEAKISVTHAFARAWHLIGEHFGTVFGATLLVWMALTALLFTPCILGPILSLVFAGPFFGGLFLLFLKIIREGEAMVGDMFGLIRESAAPLMLVYIFATTLSKLGTCFCVLPGLYLYIGFILAVPIVADQNVNFWQGLVLSLRAVTKQWFRFCGIFLIGFLPVVVFHYYMTYRLGMELSPFFSQIIDIFSESVQTGVPNRAELQKIMADIQKIQVNYASWALMKQVLLLISMPLGIGSIAFVYEDLFGKKR